MTKVLVSKSDNIPEERRVGLEKKLTAAISRMAFKTQNGGNPFLFLFAATKTHYLLSSDDPSNFHHTACTTGEYFEWDADFLESLDRNEVRWVMEHEVNHIISAHCTPELSIGRDRQLLAVVVDFFATGMIDHFHEQCQRSWSLYEGEVIKKPYGVEEYRKWLDGTLDSLPPFAGDMECLDRAPVDVYNDLLPHFENSPRRCLECKSFTLNPSTGESRIPRPWKEPHCAACGAPVKFGPYGEQQPFRIQGDPGPMDEHREVSEEKARRMNQEVMRIAETVQKTYGRGKIPGFLQNKLSELENPTLSVNDLLQNVFTTRKVRTGDKKDWSQFRRRPEYIYEQDQFGKYVPKTQIFRPMTKSFFVNYFCMVDCSASMIGDIERGIKEIQLVASMYKNRGQMVPVDTQPYWEHIIEINSVNDLSNFKPTGLGGTNFQTFFEDFRERYEDDDIDILFIITDGDVDHVPLELLPRKTDLVWIITSEHGNFKPNAGRVIYLNQKNRKYAESESE